MVSIAPVYTKAPTLKSFFEGVPADEQEKYYKTLSFIADFDKSLDKIVANMKDNAFYIWTIGNRFVGNREVPNDQVLIELMESRGIQLFERAERQILNKKQPKKNNFSKTMEKEHILIFHRSM
jgi:site-specific DNA-methyltransferase (cytosine-N4-specific)